MPVDHATATAGTAASLPLSAVLGAWVTVAGGVGASSTKSSSLNTCTLILSSPLAQLLPTPANEIAGKERCRIQTRRAYALGVQCAPGERKGRNRTQGTININTRL